MSASAQSQQGNLDRYVVIHVATTCDEHGVYVTKDSAEVIELGWILLDAKSCEEVGPTHYDMLLLLYRCMLIILSSFTARACLSSLSIHPSHRSAVSWKRRPRAFTYHSDFHGIDWKGIGILRTIADMCFLQLA